MKPRPAAPSASAPPPPPDEVAGALRLRSWALRALWEAPVSAPPAEPARAWSLFLRADRCALPLAGRLDARGGWEGIAPDAAAELRRVSMIEVKRALSAQAELRRVSAVLRQLGWNALVLKGGTYLMQGNPPVDVHDVDVLLRPEQAGPLGEALTRAGGYRTVGEDAAPGTPGRWEGAVRAAAGAVAVEVHFDVPFLGRAGDPWEGALPLGPAGLFRLSPALHLWHVLVHGVTHHPERRGAIRDLLVLAAARRDCAPDDLARVHAVVRTHPHRALMAAALRMAEEAAGGSPPVDRFAAPSALRFMLMTRGDGTRRTMVVHSVAAAACEGPAELLREVLGGSGDDDTTLGPPGPLWSLLRIGSRVGALPSAFRWARSARALAASAS
ncbi:nucleotidyltransferase family protein [Longimicrobium terrae]|uniref:Nucleotidyltransferase family protein n=1 Tax=Longimicrobium terrae TaxID=1639882 RepID=A0A841GV59_9BACT|nr:nucleotidyltransferase family protein [Longimicrobium terrae]MBB4634545.1 hypothetical protein [Longimicrobium terrae]MBB6068565.1 hypothetical protein [Longimicrobium terrae]NNC27752.1 hypothetical protein [Longimicrobium terrae]